MAPSCIILEIKNVFSILQIGKAISVGITSTPTVLGKKKEENMPSIH